MDNLNNGVNDRSNNAGTDFSSGKGRMLVSDIVKSDYRAAAVFEQYGIDFCCKGNRMLDSACGEKGIDTSAVIGELERLGDVSSADNNRYELWDLDYLGQYIINNHHNYIRNSVPRIAAHVEKVAYKHGGRHPHIIEVESLFSQISAELLSHLQKEEKILFPMINSIAEQARSGKNASDNMVSISGPVSVMEAEHSGAGEILERIRELTDNFTLPADACNTFAVTYQELKEFETDLHKHIFLENSILFPRAVQLENQLKAA